MGAKWVTVVGGRVLLIDDLGRDQEGNQVLEIGEGTVQSGVLSVEDAKAILKLGEMAAGEGLGTDEADALMRRLIEGFGLEALGYRYYPWWLTPAMKGESK